MIERIGRYRLAEGPDRIVGRGNYATVYRAFDAIRDRDVAIKVLAENHSLDLDTRERFLTEARLMDRVARTSRRVVSVYDIEELPNGQPYFVMELAEGGSLERRLSRHGTPRPAEIRRLISELGACLEALHSVGVVHRDLKPANVLLSGEPNDEAQLLGADERVVLADLGLAKDLDRSTSTMSLGIGTVGYMAPELLTDPASADHRVDIFAASVLIGRAVGWSPHAGADVPPALPSAAAKALRAGADADPAERPRSAAKWTESLLDAWPSEMRRVGGRSRFRRRLPAGVAAVAIVALAAVGWFVLRDPAVDPTTVTVGEPVVLRVDAPPSSPVTWSVGDDETTGDETLALTPSEPGRVDVTATWTDPSGAERSERIELEITR